MEKTESAASELSYLLRMLRAMPDTGSVEKIYRMLLALTTAGRAIGFNRAMLFLVDPGQGVIKGHIAAERRADRERLAEKPSYEQATKEVFETYEGIDSSDLTLKVRTYTIPFDWHRSALVKAARCAYPVLAEGKVSEFATDPFFEFFDSKGYLAIPLAVYGNVRAVLAADHALDQRPIDVDDISLLYSLVQQASGAIERLLEVGDSERKFRILRKLGQALRNADTPERLQEALKLSLAMISRAVDGAGGFLKDRARGRMLHVKTVEEYSLSADDDDIAISECFQEILDKVAVRMESVSGDSGHALVSTEASQLIDYFFACPLPATAEVTGALSVYAKKRESKRDEGEFSPNDKRFLELCAGAIASKLEIWEMENRFRRQEGLLEEIHSNLTRERDRSRIGEKGIEFHERVREDVRQMEGVLRSSVPASKRLSRVKEILTDIRRHTSDYSETFTSTRSDFQLVDLFKVAREVVREWKPKAEKKGIELSVRIPSQGPFLLMDREKIATALRNILMSVISFLSGKEKVLVECSTTEDRVLIVIADTGEGLPGDILSRLFMPFTEATQEDERKRALSLAGEILHTHAGEVTVKTSIDWKTIIILSFSRAANQDRRKRRGDRRERRKDRRSASRR